MSIVSQDATIDKTGAHDTGKHRTMAEESEAYDTDAEPNIEHEDPVFAKGFTTVPNAFLLGFPGLSMGARCTYIMLLHFSWQDGSCFPSQDTLAESLGVTARCARDYLRELKDAGLLSARRRGLGKSNVYTILRIPSLPINRNDGTAPDRKPPAALDRTPGSYYEDSPYEYPMTNAAANRAREDDGPHGWQNPLDVGGDDPPALTPREAAEEGTLLQVAALLDVRGKAELERALYRAIRGWTLLDPIAEYPRWYEERGHSRTHPKGRVTSFTEWMDIEEQQATAKRVKDDEWEAYDTEGHVQTYWYYTQHPEEDKPDNWVDTVRIAQAAITKRRALRAVVAS